VAEGFPPLPSRAASPMPPAVSPLARGEAAPHSPARPDHCSRLHADSMKRILPLLALLAACGDDGGSRQQAGAAAPAASDTTWTTVARQETGDRTTLPERFQTTREQLRVILSVGQATSEYTPGLVRVNLQEREASLPVVSMQLQGLPIDSVHADTSLVTVRPGSLLLFVPEQHGVKEWSVVVQEQRK